MNFQKNSSLTKKKLDKILTQFYSDTFLVVINLFEK